MKNRRLSFLIAFFLILSGMSFLDSSFAEPDNLVHTCLPTDDCELLKENGFKLKALQGTNGSVIEDPMRLEIAVRGVPYTFLIRNTSDKDYFVPTRTDEEYNSFLLAACGVDNVADIPPVYCDGGIPTIQVRMRFCGDGTCEGSPVEGCGTDDSMTPSPQTGEPMCNSDCGVCPVTCGDGFCAVGLEHCTGGGYSNPCVECGPCCGNGVRDPAEQCEGGNLNGETCPSLTGQTGTLLCTGACEYNTNGCDDVTCITNTIQGRTCYHNRPADTGPAPIPYICPAATYRWNITGPRTIPGGTSHPCWTSLECPSINCSSPSDMDVWDYDIAYCSTTCDPPDPPDPVNGVCDNSVQNGCVTGIPNDAAVDDTATDYKWICWGHSGGVDSGECSTPKIPCVPTAWLDSACGPAGGCLLTEMYQTRVEDCGGPSTQCIAHAGCIITCPAVAANAGCRAFPETAASTLVAPGCSAGYTGVCSSTCDAAGSWGAVTSTCVLAPITCPAVAASGGCEAFPETAASTLATPGCSAGYAGACSNTCDAAGSWGAVTNTCSLIQCPAVGASGGCNAFPVTNASTLASPGCSAGYAGACSSTCDAAGSWGAVTNTCVVAPITCPAVGASGGCRAFPETAASTLASPGCSAGYAGACSSTCDAAGSWGAVTNTCSLIQCPVVAASGGCEAFPVTNASTLSSPGCIGGYTGVCSSTCNAAGSWGAVTNTCVFTPITCPAVGAGGGCNAFPETASSTFASPGCSAGYSGSCSNTCDAAGSWGAVTNTCSLNQCPAVGASGGCSAFPVTNASTFASPGCSAGYSGSCSSTCNAAGSWGAVTNTCSLIQCPAVGAGGGCNAFPVTNASTFASPGCSAGYSGSCSSTCGAGGSWGALTNTCSLIQCPAVGASGGCDPFPVTNASTLSSPGCSAGYSGSCSSTCNAAGSWGAVTNTCSVNQCPAVGAGGGCNAFPVTNPSTFSSPGCSTGYSGSCSSTCNAAGSWGAVTNTCSINQCPAIGTGLFNCGAFPVKNAGQFHSTGCHTTHSGAGCTWLCNNNGDWDGVTAGTSYDCTLNTCPAVGASGGCDAFPVTDAGGSSSPGCVAGYTGACSNTCNDSGSWGSRTNTCTPVQCPAIGSGLFGCGAFPLKNAGQFHSTGCDSTWTGTGCTWLCNNDGDWDGVSAGTAYDCAPLTWGPTVWQRTCCEPEVTTFGTCDGVPWPDVISQPENGECSSQGSTHKATQSNGVSMVNCGGELELRALLQTCDTW